MVAADTSRSRAYLEALIRNELFPNYVLLLENAENSLPGQWAVTQSDSSDLHTLQELDPCWSEADFNPSQSLRVLLERWGVPYSVAPNNNINAPEVVEILAQRPESVFIYSGFGGVLLRQAVISVGKRFLHVHGGYLPMYKGSTTNYYSLLANNTMGASAIFLSETIDSGPVLMRREFPPPANRQKIDHVYDSAARAKVLVETLQRYVPTNSWEFDLPDNDGGDTYYIIHPVLKHIAILDKETTS
jgi:methionyl-tRNA formyltransferase